MNAKNPVNSLIFDNFYSWEFYYYEDDVFDFTEEGGIGRRGWLVYFIKSATCPEILIAEMFLRSFWKPRREQMPKKRSDSVSPHS